MAKDVVYLVRQGWGRAPLLYTIPVKKRGKGTIEVVPSAATGFQAEFTFVEFDEMFSPTKGKAICRWDDGLLDEAKRLKDELGRVLNLLDTIVEDAP